MLRDEVGEGPAVLLFLSPTCTPCQKVGESLQVRNRGLGSPESSGRARMVIVTEEAEPDVYQARGMIDAVVRDPNSDLKAALDIRATPFGIALDRGGVVRASSVVASPGQATDLADSVADGTPVTVLAPA
jgi:hypothetical protein